MFGVDRGHATVERLRRARRVSASQVSCTTWALMGRQLRSHYGERELRRRWSTRVCDNLSDRGTIPTATVGRLSDREALTLALVDSAGGSYREAAAFLMTTERRVARLVAKARSKLRDPTRSAST